MQPSPRLQRYPQQLCRPRTWAPIGAAGQLQKVGIREVLASFLPDFGRNGVQRGSNKLIICALLLAHVNTMRPHVGVP